jgi:hypothetical protein
MLRRLARSTLPADQRKVSWSFQQFLPKFANQGTDFQCWPERMQLIARLSLDVGKLVRRKSSVGLRRTDLKDDLATGRAMYGVDSILAAAA